MATVPWGVHPNSFATRRPPQAQHCLTGRPDSSSPSAQAFLYTMLYFKLSQVPNSREVQQGGLLLSPFCWACWCLACPFVIPPSHFEVLRSYWQLFAFFPSPLFPERKKIVPETWESAKNFLCLKGIFKLSCAPQELLSNNSVLGDSRHKCTRMGYHPHACPGELAPQQWHHRVTP